ncbi:unnamed protein product [Mytilus coruscus]|uniref:Uncharacterized protein n=2 Tax=Mytilus coruscus TaxID=42192 RepID=A0A6J8D9U9_MYTCO|nr:unnamed protein product [Mytilus coruscus]
MGTNSDFDSAYFDSVFVSQTLSDAGFVVNIEKSIWKPCQELIWLEYKVPSIIVYSDASSFACGAYSCQLDNQIFHKMWTGGEKELSSTSRELKAIELCIDTFQDSMYGPHSVDRFADSNNKKIELFNSRFYTPGSSGVDAFSFDWKEDNNWLVPPIHLVCRVIKHCIAYKVPVSSIPASDYHVSLYIVYLMQNDCSASKIDEVIYSVGFAHRIAGFVNSCSSDLVVQVAEGAKRQLSRPSNKKEPITAEILTYNYHVIKMQNGIFGPVNNDQQQQSIFDIFKQNKRADNTDETLRNDDILQNQNVIISFMDDCNGQFTTKEQPNNENFLNCQNKTEMDDTQRIVQHRTHITKT